MKNLVLLGSTGSIGTQTLEIVDAYPERLHVVALAAGSNVDKMEEQIRKYNPSYAVMYEEKAAEDLKVRVADLSVKVLSGMDGLLEIVVLPGATAFVPALVSSGLPCDRFCFEGFLPQKKGRHTRLEQLKSETRTMIFYESPHRLVKTLGQLAEVFGENREACVCREISKLYEEKVRGTLSEVAAHFMSTPPKGEIVLVVAGMDAKKKKKEE